MEETPEQRLYSLAATQLGLFTYAQATACGMTRQMIRTRLTRGAFRRLYRDVFHLEGHHLSEPSKHLALVLAVGGDARCSHRAAGWLWSMTPHHQKPEVTVTTGQPRLSEVRIHRTRTELLPPEIRLGVPVTTAAETLLDIGAVLPLHRVRDAMDRGIANRVVTPMSALEELKRRGGFGVPGTAHLRKLLDDAGLTGSHHPSLLEAKMRRLIKKAGLPQPRCELIVGKNGEYRLDFSWPELMLAVEVDGWMYHSSFAAFHGNKSRKNSLTIEGFTVLEYTWIHVTKTPSVVVREVSAAYAAKSRLLCVR